MSAFESFLPGPSGIDESYIERLKARLVVNQRLADAIRDYLCFDVEQTIKRTERGPSGLTAFKPTDQMLVDAQQRVEALQTQVAGIEEEMENTQLDDMRGMYRNLILPQIKQQLETAQRELSWMRGKDGKAFDADRYAAWVFGTNNSSIRLRPWKSGKPKRQVRWDCPVHGMVRAGAIAKHKRECR